MFIVDYYYSYFYYYSTIITAANFPLKPLPVCTFRGQQRYLYFQLNIISARCCLQLSVPLLPLPLPLSIILLLQVFLVGEAFKFCLAKFFGRPAKVFWVPSRVAFFPVRPFFDFPRRDCCSSWHCCYCSCCQQTANQQNYDKQLQVKGATQKQQKSENQIGKTDQLCRKVCSLFVRPAFPGHPLSCLCFWH